MQKEEVKKKSLEINPALADISVDELEEVLRARKAHETKLKQQKRESYEKRREEMINTLGGFAVSLRGQMLDLKVEAFGDLAKFRLEMLEYGDIRGGENNKGSFELKNDQFKIKFSSQINKHFDERAELAEKKLKEFLSSFVKKRDRPSYDLVLALLERNSKTGDFDVNLINRLYKMRDRFDNPLWIEALDMFQESYSPYGTAQYIQFYTRNDKNNSWDAVVLDFAKLKAFSNATNDQDNQDTAADKA